MHADMSQTGASIVAKRAALNPREMLIRLVEAEPKASKDTLFARFREELQIEEEYQKAVDWYFFINMYEYLTTSRNQKPATRKDAAAARTRQVEAITRRVVEVVLLDLVLPNGKALRDCTFADCAKAGGFFAKIAKKGKPKQIVGKVLSEDDLRALR